MSWEVELVRCNVDKNDTILQGTDVQTCHLPDRIHVEGHGADAVTLGRAPSVGTTCVDFGPKSVVSKEHAALSCEDGAFRMKDLGSTNGTFVNWTKITEAALREGDSVIFGGGRNIPIGHQMTRQQRANTQLLEWKFHVVRAPFLSAASSSPKELHTDDNSGLTPTLRSKKRQSSQGEPLHPPPPVEPSTVESPPQLPSGEEELSANSSQRQRETMGASGISPPKDGPEPHISDITEHAAAVQETVEPPAPIQDEEWLINDDSDSVNEISPTQHNVHPEGNGYANDAFSVEEEEDLVQMDQAAEPKHDDTQENPELDQSIYLLMDDSPDLEAEVAVSPTKMAPPQHLPDDLQSENSNVLEDAQDDLDEAAFASQAVIDEEPPLKRHRQVEAGAEKYFAEPHAEATSSSSHKKEIHTLFSDDMNDLRFQESSSSGSFDAFPTTQSFPNTLSQPPVIPLPPEPLPFVAIPPQRLAAVRVGKVRVKACTSMEFTEMHWKVTVDNPNFGAGGTFRLIVAIPQIVWYKDHVSKKPFFFVVSTKSPLPGVQPGIYDPNASDLGQRTLVFECVTKNESKSISKLILDNYMKYLTPANCNIVPEKEVYKYFNG